MSSTDINFKEFVKYVHQHFEDSISHDEVHKILYLKQGYNKDSPTSLGKSLVLNRLIFSGKKISGEEYRYDQLLHKGFNVWIADNHKGKSTIFKIIKFAITGDDSIKRDIKTWINEILLEFNIGQITYTSFIDRKGRDRGAVYRFGIKEFLELRENKKLDSVDRETEFEFKSQTQFEEKAQEFFFDQFSFYTLKYTQKNSAKGEFELNTANLSWATYFKSIYLESSNYEYLFFDMEKSGAQGKKIFEMILGLPLTYPINMLSLQLDKILEEIGKLRLVDKSKTETTKAQKEKLEKSYEEVTQQLGEAGKIASITFNEKAFIDEYNQINEKVNEIRKRQRLAQEAYDKETAKQHPLEEELVNLQADKTKIEAEIRRLAKQELNVELYKQAESFFSNLDVKVCPHCETEVSEDKRVNERSTHACSLCGETPTGQKIEETELQAKADRIRQEIAGHENRLLQVNKNIERQRQAIENLKRTVAGSYDQLIAIPSIIADQQKLAGLEEKIEAVNRERKNQKSLLDQKEELIKREAVLKFQLEEIKKEKQTDYSGALAKLQLTKDILEYALTALGKKRIKLNETILNILEELILKEVNAFGLISITKVVINDKFNLTFTQNSVAVDFKELEPGEKLRIKLAFYLSLIQLDIEHSLGRHPRFLIFDSPGSEEMVPKHLHGLADILKNVNERFEDQLQIFVGSALREFAQITEPEKVFMKEDEEFVF